MASRESPSLRHLEVNAIVLAHHWELQGTRRGDARGSAAPSDLRDSHRISAGQRVAAPANTKYPPIRHRAGKCPP